MTETNLEAAIELANAGWNVLPCIESGHKAKAPYTTHGHLDATREPEVIRSWWLQWPHALIGARVPEPLVVLDIDPRNGGSVEALEALLGPLPPTLTSWSGRGDGGCHLFYLRPAGALTSARVPAGIDLKVNGYVIVPPSIHPVSGKPYRWEDRPVVALPPAARELLRPGRMVDRTRSTRSDGSPLVRLVAGLTNGERNRGLFWAACRAADDGILAVVEHDLIAAALSTGLDEREVRRVIASAHRTTGGVR